MGLLERFSKKEFNKENLFAAFMLSILYSATSYLLLEANMIPELHSGDIRPSIFLPAIVSIMYGPIIGGLAAGFGNLLVDIIKKEIITHEGLEIKHLIGFLANLMGGIVTGVIGKFLNLNAQNFEKKAFIKKWVQIAINLLRNTIASIIGYGVVIGLIIGEGLAWAYPNIDFKEGIIISAHIFYWNSLFLLIFVPGLLLLIMYTDSLFSKWKLEELNRRRHLKIVYPKKDRHDLGFEIIDAISPIGDELYAITWGAVELTIKNTGNETVKFLVSIISNDVFSPTEQRTPLLAPGEIDTLYFNVYPTSPGVNDAIVRVQKVLPSTKKQMHLGVGNVSTYDLKMIYDVGTSSDFLINRIMGFFFVIGLLVTIAIMYFNIKDQLRLSREILFSLLVIPVEIILLLIYFWLKKQKITELTMSMLSKGGTQVVNVIVAPIKLISKKKNEETKKYYYFALGFYFLSILAVIVLFYQTYVIVILKRTPTDAAYIVIFVTMTLSIVFPILATHFYEDISESVETINDLIPEKVKIIEKVIIEQNPIKFRNTKIKLLINNPQPDRGLRIFFHSFDHVIPRKMTLPGPFNKKMIEINYVPLAVGKRELAVEFVEYFDDKGRVIDIEEAETIDQETVFLNVHSGSILGISPKQINLLKKILTLAGVIALSIAFIAKIFNYSLDPDSLSTSLSLMLLLQTPVLYLYLYLSNKVEKIIKAEE